MDIGLTFGYTESARFGIGIGKGLSSMPIDDEFRDKEEKWLTKV
jgi:hypothetical protein